MTGKLRSLVTLWRNQSLRAEQLEELQLRKLRAVVRAAIRDVPFYRELYEKCGVDADQIRTLDDLRRLPMVTKAQMRASGLETVVSELLARQCRATLHTSGTTGVPLTIPLAPVDTRIRSLVEFRGLLTLGFRPLDTLVTVGPGFRRPPAFHERLGLFRTVVVSGAYSLDEQVRRLRRLRPDILWCYSSELRALLHHADHPLRDVRPRLLIVSAAVLDDSVRRMAEQELRCPVFLSYGCMETGRIAIECPTHHALHVVADHVLLEIVNGDREVRPGESGEVVLTTLNQAAMPFIRYRLADLTSWLGERCGCGSAFPVIRAPEGRVEEPLRFRNGLQLSPTRFSIALRALDGVDRYLVVQESLDWVRVLIASIRPLKTDELDRLRAHLLDGIPAGVRLDFEQVDRIEEVAKKHRQMISKLGVD
jgi:phenylacetate-CoA ligase